MVLSGFLFLSWRIFELVITTPIVGMLGWFVNRYVNANILTPTSILVLFIVSVLALAWVVFTIISYVRARHDALLVAFIDLCFVGAFIAGVVLLRYWGSANCSNLSAGLTTNGSYFNLDVNKQCAMLKASFALGIIDILNFFVTVFLALLVWRHHRSEENRDNQRVVKREYSRNSRHGGSGSRHRRSNSGGGAYRGSRDYDRRSGSGRRDYSSRRQYYV